MTDARLERSRRRPLGARPTLVVDDEPTLRHLLASFLRAAGLDVLTAPDGATAVELVRARGAALVFVDFRMPGLDGLETAARVRELDPDVPIVVVTGEPQAVDPERLARVRPCRLLAKPFTRNEVLTCVPAPTRGWCASGASEVS